MAGTFPEWIYDGSPIDDPGGHGERAVQFLRRLKHPASTAPGNLFQLTPWQERIVRRIYGPRYPDGRRIVKEVFLMIPRGNRKTSLAAALALLHLLGPERVPAGQIIFAASDREQAGIGFREAVDVIRADRRLGQVTRIYDAHNSAKMIRSTIDGSTLKAIPADGKGQHGTTPTFVLADETHIWRGRELWEALRTGMAKRPGGLIVMATTAGRGREGLAAERYDYARKIALGEIANEEYLPILFEPQEGDDWQDEAMWHRVNPGLAHGFPDIDGLRTLAREAVDSPSEMYAFRQFHLNEWMGNSHDPLFNFETYDARRFDDDDEDLTDLPCWVGVDLSRSGDLTAVVAAFLWPDGQVTLRPKFFVPGEDLKARSDRDGVPYQAWADQGLIHLCPGKPIIDEEAVEAEIREICGTYDVQEVAFDPHLAARIMQRLYDDGLPVVELRQSPLNMGLAGADLEKIVNGRLVRHDGHPVLRNHLSSVVAVRTDSGLTRMVKGRKTDRIDGAVAAAMAVSRACAGQTNLSSYNSPDASLFVF